MSWFLVDSEREGLWLQSVSDCHHPIRMRPEGHGDLFISYYTGAETQMAIKLQTTFQIHCRKGDNTYGIYHILCPKIMYVLIPIYLYTMGKCQWHWRIKSYPLPKCHGDNSHIVFEYAWCYWKTRKHIGQVLWNFTLHNFTPTKLYNCYWHLRIANSWGVNSLLRTVNNLIKSNRSDKTAYRLL